MKKKITLFILLIFIFSVESFANNKSKMYVSVKLFVNKIYNFDTIHESFNLDGYLVMSWKDRNNNFGFNNSLEMYENGLMDTFISENNIQFPIVEFINTLGAREITNKRLIIKPEGDIIYNERFNAVFHNKMNFRKFPFDTQSFKIQIEPFSLDKSKFEFINDGGAAEINFENSLSEWIVESNIVEIYDVKYHHLSDTAGNNQVFSRLEYRAVAKRLSGYYVWQVLFPLILIIISSWVVFWLKDFSDQLATSFTLMLTVVAFNFYSTSFLPQLSYDTFIESFIRLGYIFIFTIIIAIVILRSLKEKYPLNNNITMLFRLIYPSASLIAFLLVVMHFFFNFFEKHQ